MNEYYKQQDGYIRAHWFPKHVAKFDGDTRLTWRNPDSTNYLCRYVIDGNYLIAYGDIGEAVYGWGQKITFNFVAGCDLHYFAGKCEASETGRRYEHWDAAIAKAKLDRMFADQEKETGQTTMRMSFREAGGGDDNFASSMDWTVFLHEHGWDVFGDDLEGLGDIGTVTNIRCHGHLIGVKMALAQPCAACGEAHVPAWV